MKPIWKVTNASDQIFVEGHPFTLRDVVPDSFENEIFRGKLFHGSPYAVAIGDVFKPKTQKRNFRQSAANQISVTSSPARAAYWARKAAPGATIYVYEVEPIGEVHFWNAMATKYDSERKPKAFILWEGRVSSATNLALVGTYQPPKKP